MTARGLRIVPDEPDIQNAQWRRTATAIAEPDTALPVDADVERSEDGLAVPAALLRLAPTAEERRWTTEALCADGDPDRLFVTGAAQREAAKLCRDCPVLMECLADALDNRIEFGVWGGLTERQRRALLKRRPDVTSWRDLLESAREDGRRGVAS
jgi:WhiB family redox-sensing transcriptional regulator